MESVKYSSHKSSFGIDANIVILIVWFGAFLVSMIRPIAILSSVVPFVILFLEKDSQLVKLHAVQSISLFIFNILANIVIFLIPLLVLVFWIVAIIELILVITAASKGWNYQEYDLPFIQPIADLVKKYLLR